jgi:hypothetical protein
MFDWFFVNPQAKYRISWDASHQKYFVEESRGFGRWWPLACFLTLEDAQKRLAAIKANPSRVIE